MTQQALRIHHVVPSVSVSYGGPSRSVPALCDALTELGHRVTLHTYGPTPAGEQLRYELLEYREPLVASRFGLSMDILHGLRAAARDSDILHVHGLWTFSSLISAWAVRGTQCRLVVAPRGMLDPWALQQSAYKKRLAWVTAQGRAARAAQLMHATAMSEARAIRDMGLRAPIAVVPNGVDIPADADVARFDRSPRTLLFLSRIHPKKGLDGLLSAWGDVQREFPDWRLHVVGPSNSDYLPKLKRMVHERGLERLEFFGVAEGAAKTEHFRSAQMFILPTHSENFGLAVAEALAYGLPVIVGRGAPWQDVETHQCGYWIDNAASEIAACLRVALRRSPEELRQSGARGRTWMQREYSWLQVAEMMADAYAWLVRGRPIPASIVVGDVTGAA